MTKDELYELTLKDLKINEIHPLHKAIMEECCENALDNPEKIADKKILNYAVRVAFLTSLSALIGTLKGGLKMADSITLNYRNQTFTITKDSPLLNDKNDS